MTVPRANTLSRQSYNKGYQSRRHARLRAEGKCVDCGQNPAKPSRKDPTKPGARCVACAEKAAKVSLGYINRKRPAWVALGFCVLCGKNESMKTTSHGASKDTRCAACADQQLEHKESKHVRKHAA